MVTRLIDCDPLTRSYITDIHVRSYLTLQRFCLFFREDLLLSPPLARCLSRRGVLAGSGRPINPIRHGSSSARAAVLQFMNLLWAPPRIPRGGIDLSLRFASHERAPSSLMYAPGCSRREKIKLTPVAISSRRRSRRTFVSFVEIY